LIRSYHNLPFEWIIVRPTSIWGPWFDVPYKMFFDHVRARRYIHPKNMLIYKSFGFVGNTVYQLKKLMNTDAAAITSNTFYLGDYIPIEISCFSNIIAKEFCVTSPITLPFAVLAFFAKCGDLLEYLGFKNQPLTSFRLNNLITEMIYNFTEISEITGPLPFTVDQGVSLTVKWMNSQINS